MASLRILVLLAGLGVASAQAQPVAPAPSASVDGGYATDQSFRLGTGDKLRITTYGDPDLSGEFVVGPDGSLAFPLIGNVPAGGRTVDEVQRQITAALAKGYVRNPRVSTEVLTYRPYFILGEVNKPGRYAYNAALTVYNAVATAEGFTYRANKRVVYIKHANKDGEEKIRLDANTLVQPGDTVRIVERYF